MQFCSLKFSFSHATKQIFDHLLRETANVEGLRFSSHSNQFLGWNREVFSVDPAFEGTTDFFGIPIKAQFAFKQFCIQTMTPLLAFKAEGFRKF